MTNLCILIGATVLSTLPVLGILWWGDNVSH